VRVHGTDVVVSAAVALGPHQQSAAKAAALGRRRHAAALQGRQPVDQLFFRVPLFQLFLRQQRHGLLVAAALPRASAYGEHGTVPRRE
jgi:hypothetical protein